MHLGVDFGTSNTVAVLRWPDGRARPLLFDGSPLLPSAVYAEPDGALVVGRDAVHSARLDPGRFEPNPKRRIDDGMLLLGDREVPLAEVVTAVLSRVTEELRRTAGPGPVEATLTCPASWGATRRLVLADAARSAGLGEVRLVAEPVAAATYFTNVLGREVPIGSVVVVYDFGAGTIDVSVVARTSTGFEVLAVDGRDDIGGLDIDAALVDLIGKACAEQDADAWKRLMNPSTVEERRARRLLWDDVRTAKERLSRHPATDLTVPLLNVDVRVTRHELEERARPLLDQTVRVTQAVMRWANLADGRLAGVFLVGGSSRIPLVATLLHRALGEAPAAIEQPELVVAEGSLLAGAAAVPVSAGPAPGPATGVPALVLPPPAPAVVAAAAASVSPAGLARPVGRVVVPGASPAPASGARQRPGASPAPAPTAPAPGVQAARYEAAAPRPPAYQPGKAAPWAAARPPRPEAAAMPAAMPAAVAPAATGPRRQGHPRTHGRGGRVLRALLLIAVLGAVLVGSAFAAYQATLVGYLR
jgi:Ethanolamine utilization protein EutJ (predicted chaperonin)